MGCSARAPPIRHNNNTATMRLRGTRETDLVELISISPSSLCSTRRGEIAGTT
jgi:hypothetical protein